MEKSTPQYDLAAIQAQVARLGAAAFTKTALDGGRDMGLTSREMLAVIAALTRRNFYKSMTTHADHRIWQDVYYSPTPVDQEAYIKITMRDLTKLPEVGAVRSDRGVRPHRDLDARGDRGGDGGAVEPPDPLGLLDHLVRQAAATCPGSVDHVAGSHERRHEVRVLLAHQREAFLVEHGPVL